MKKAKKLKVRRGGKKRPVVKKSPVKKKKKSPVRKRPVVKVKKKSKKRPVKKVALKKSKIKKLKRPSAKDKTLRKKHLKVIVAQLNEEKLFVQERVEKAKRDEWIGQVNDEIDNAVASAERDILFERVDRLIQRLDEIDNALKKAELKRFGICEKCGMEVSIKRLKLIPYARYCYRCISRD